MSVICLFDLHLRPGPMENELHAFLAAHLGDTVIYGGDTVEGHAMDNLRGFSEETRDVLIAARLERRLVVGNHDNEIKEFRWAAREVEIAPGVVVTHGHLFDIYCWPGLPELWNDLLGRITWRLHVGGSPALARLTRRFRDIGWAGRAGKWMANWGIQHLICGHTHRPEEITLASGRRISVGYRYRHAITIEEERKP